MSRLWTSGFEQNSGTNGVEWQTYSGSPTTSSSTKRSGTYAGQISSLSSGTLKSFIYAFLASQNNGPFYVRTYLLLSILPSAENRIISGRDATASADRIYITLDQNGVLRLYDEDGVIGSPSSSLSTNTWYIIEWKFDASGSVGSHIIEAKMAVAGSPSSVFASASNRSISQGIDTLRLGGNLNSESQTTGSWFFDDIAINDGNGSFQNNYPGDGAVIVLRPSAAGDNTGWTRAGSDTGANWSQVSEVTPDDANTMLTSNVVDTIDDYNIDNTPSTINSTDFINVVSIGVRVSLSNATDPDPNAVLRIKALSGGTVEESSNIGVTGTTWRTNADNNPRNPLLTLYDLPGSSTTPWTKADLDTAQIGIRCSVNDVSTFRVSTIWLVVEYSAISPPPSSTTYKFIGNSRDNIILQ